MQKTGLKTFVYSFSVSLFAIFAANGVYLRTHPSNPQDIQIPSKNVMLFLKDAAVNPSLKPAPVKKIALSVLPELQVEPILPELDTVYEPPADDVIMADNFIPLEVGTVFEEIEPVDEVVVASEDYAPIEIIAEKAPASQVKTEPKPIVAKVAVQVTEPEQERIIIPPKVSTEIVVAKNDSAPEQKNKEKPLVVAQNDLPTPLVPLEKSKDERLNRQKVRIGEPDKLNQVALADKNIPISSMQDTTPSPDNSEEWAQMSDKKTDNPWVTAKSASAVKNELLLKEDFYQNDNVPTQKSLEIRTQTNKAQEVKVAAETVKNLLIPIPEDILNDENLTPQLSYSSENNSTEDVKSPEAEPEETKQVAEAKPEENSKKDSILSSLNTIFANATKGKQSSKGKGSDKSASNLLDDLQKKLSPSKKITIMPTEMRLAFQPNRAEISGQTLRWIQAFAVRAATDVSTSIEIRIDGTSSMDLQQKRLNLLHNILTNKGVEYSKINTVFTSREPNSFIIKTVTRRNDRKEANKNINARTAGYYLQW